jgi:HD-like signal output (HDOD) protein
MLTFATYLLKTGSVPPLAMAEAIVAQRESRPSLGELAVARGKITQAVLEALLLSQRRRRIKIGQAAVDAGALTEAEVEQLLEEQSSLEPDLADVLVNRGILTRDAAEEERARFRAIEEELERPPLRETKANASFASSVAKLSQLKPFSDSTREALDLLSDPHVAPAIIGATLETDPAVTIATLRVANSALYRRGRACDSLADAIVRLGAGTIRDIVTGISLLGAFPENDRAANATRQHLAGAAALAHTLAGAVLPQLSNVAFLAGLTHDIGKLLLMQSGEFSYDSVPRDAFESGGKLHVFEDQALGYDHAVLGGLSLGFWQLPKIVADAVAFHHEPMRAHVAGGDTAALTALLVLASEFDHHLTMSPHYTYLVEREIATNPEAHYLGLEPSAIEEIWVELVQARAEMAALLSR